MNKDLHDIDDLFRNSINGHAKEVPADVWKNIDHRLDKRQAAFYKRKYFAIRAAAILFVLVGGIAMAAILHFNQQEKTPSKESVHQDAITSTGVKSEPVKNPVRSQPSEERAMETADKQNTFPSNEHAGNDDPSHSTTNSAKNQTLEGLKSTDVQKNKEIALALPANKAHLKKAASDKSANKSMIEVATQSNTIQERAVNKQVVAGASSTRVVKDFSRTQYASIDPPAITTVDFAASLPVADLKSSVLSLPASTSLLSTAKKSKQKDLLAIGVWHLRTHKTYI